VRCEENGERKITPNKNASQIKRTGCTISALRRRVQKTRYKCPGQQFPSNIHNGRMEVSVGVSVVTVGGVGGIIRWDRRLTRTLRIGSNKV